MGRTVRKRIETVGVGSLCAALGLLAFVHEGVPAAEVELNDGGVWVTNVNKQLVAHLNYQSQTLDGGLRTSVTPYDVSQFGTDILVTSQDLVQPLDVAAVAFTSEAVVSDVTMSHGGDLVLFADAEKGKVWATSVEGAGGFSSSSTPTVEELDSPRVTVGADGVGYIITGDGTVKSIEDRAAEDPAIDVGSLGEDLSDKVQFTVVGDTVVALDGDRLITAERSLQIDDLGPAVLQQPSLLGDEVVVASAQALYRVPLGSGEPKKFKVSTGEPVQPVVVDGCAYGLWAKSGFYVRDCGNPDLDQSRAFPELAAATTPVFRVNRKTIVINDLTTGDSFLPLESMIKVDNWELISSQVEQEEDQKESEESDESELSQIQEFSDDQNPPEARDDDMGARAGVATTLPILLNDLDIDGDVLTAVIKDFPADVPVTLAKDGRAARVEVPPTKVGSFTFTYQAFDGEDLSNVATVTVAVRQPGSNQPPERKRLNTINISERSNAEYSVLPDWVDPDGDPIFLENAVGEEGLAVTWRPDGFISVRDLGTGGAGRRTISVTVSDGTLSETAELVVQVTPGSSNTPPVANNDHYVASVGEAITIRPLSNDTDAEADPLRLVDIEPAAPEVEIKRDHEDNSFQFTASTPGSQILVYSISDGPNTSKGKIRVDVIDPETADDKPAAENDLALLAPNASVVVEPLINDFDPAGGVLVVQGVSMGSAESLTVEVVRHSLLRITAPAGLKEPEAFEYSVSNGKASTTATVLVVPLTVKSDVQAPVALPETTVVRAGDIVTVDVLTNDYSPSDLPIKLSPDLDVRSDEALGEFFVSGDQVRFRAGEGAGRAETIYTIADSEGNVASSTVDITIKDFDDGANQQPVPRAVEARTFTSSEVRIPIPVDGVDPDGDSVELLGIGSKGPQYGSVEVKGKFLAYRASRAASGTDTFTYKVKDRFGAEGEGLVRVGVAPSPTENQAPVAVPDEIAARPGTRLEIPVTDNDVDPDGDVISIVADSVKSVDDRWDPEATIEGQKVVVTTPAEPGIYQLYYSITDGFGVPVVGVVTITADQNVPPVAPIARDDYISASEIVGLDSVDVPVLVNDVDPDGVASDLTVTVDAPATVTGGDIVNVPLAADRQIILYTVTDPDGLSARAAVVVPGKDQIPPQLNPAMVPAEVKGGETLTVDFASYVITRPDHTSKLTAVDTVKAGPGGDTTDPELGLKVVNDTTITFTPDVLFYGDTSLTFEVSDGDSLDDPRALKATLSLPITVTTSGLFPPELRPSEIKVAPGEDPVVVSLADMVSDPDEGDNARMTYVAASVSSPVDATITGQTIAVSVPPDTEVGTSGKIVVTVHDGTTDPLEMTLPVSIIKSTRPLMMVSDISEPEGRVGKPLSFDLSQVVTNPFADRGGDVELVGQPVVTGPASVTAEGLRLSVTPTDSGGAADGAEDVVVSYTVADATRDSSRYRTGVIRVTVKGVPKPPVNVTADAIGSRTARVTWSHSGWRGGSPKGFTVAWNGGSKFCGLQTSCDIDTLPNNNLYTFTVTAQVNESDIPDSDISPPSNEIFVDVLPDVPASPTAKFGDQQIGLTWSATAVKDGGSPVTSHTVEITPADASGRSRQIVAGTNLTWTNLRNGTAYTFTLTAHNKLTEMDPRVTAPKGPASSPEIPSGAPSQQGAPNVAKDKAAAGVTPRATVTWSNPGNANGNTSFVYEMRQRGSATLSYSGGANSSVVNMSVGTEDKTYEVRSTNRSGLWSEWSPASNAVRAFQPPGAPAGFSLTPTGVANQARFNFSAAAGNGAKSNEISYRWNAGGSSGSVTPGQVVTNGAFSMGNSIAVRLTAISTVNGETAEGGSANANVNTYAPPGAPNVSASGNANDVSQSWSVPGNSNGRPISVAALEPGGEVGLSGSRTVGNGRDQTHCIRARARNSEGQWGPWSNQACARTWGSPESSGRRGEPRACADWMNPGQTCKVWMLSLSRWNPNSVVSCTGSSEHWGTRTMDVRVDSGGSWGGPFHAAPNPDDWVIADGFKGQVNFGPNDCKQK